MLGEILQETYQIQERLNQNANRETWLAKDLTVDRLVVIKLIKVGRGSQWQDFKLFEREAQTLKNISHDAIPNYLDYFELNLEEERGFALVQEYIDAPSLAKAIQTGRTFTEAEIIQIGEQI